MIVEAFKEQYVSGGLQTAAYFHYNIYCHMLMFLVSENNHLFVIILGMLVRNVINICYRMLICLISGKTKILISLLSTLVGTLILDVLLLYGIHNVSSYLICYFTCSGFASHPIA
jgi:hypothetical protein